MTFKTRLQELTHGSRTSSGRGESLGTALHIVSLVPERDK